MAWQIIKNQNPEEDTGTRNQVLITNNKGLVQPCIWGQVFFMFVCGFTQMKKHNDTDI